MGSEKCKFLLTFNTIYADVGWVGQKKSKNGLTYYRDGPIRKDKHPVVPPRQKLPQPYAYRHK